ncbi:MAG: hypothetical protein ACFB6S_10650 [Geminicoccaceae bacterium]
MAASRNQKLYGTDQAPSPGILLKAGPLACELDGSSVRAIRFTGQEAIRGVDYVVRDQNWGSPPAALSEPVIENNENGFRATLDGRVQTAEIDFRFQLIVEGDAGGTLTIMADGEALSSFLTNRTGFTVLHPINGVAGEPVRVSHKDGSVSDEIFPALISPGQPIFDIRSLRHQLTADLAVTCRMEAGFPHDPDAVFEMEDQRNWTDASYKTYVGSLLDPWPYRLDAGTKTRQRILIEIEGARGQAAPAKRSEPAPMSIGEPAGQMPRIGLGIMPADLDAVSNQIGSLEGLKPSVLSVYAEAGDPDFSNVLKAYAGIAKRLETEVQLELILSAGVRPATELAAAADACRQVGLKVSYLLACPAPYLKSVQPSGPWPDVADLAHIYNAAREVFPQTKILGGMASYFTELNRKRPPPACIDAISCTNSPLVHAADDRSVMQTLEALPAIVASMGAMAPGLPVHIGPAAIAMRHNPYGADTLDNPSGQRLAMARQDPRQKGLFGAAWTAGYAAAMARTGVAQLILNHLSGPSGLIGAADDYRPVFHVMRWLCACSDQPVRTTDGGSDDVAILAVGAGVPTKFLIANLSAEPKMLSLAAAIEGLFLDEESFDAARTNSDWLDQTSLRRLENRLELGPFAVVFGQSCTAGAGGIMT